MLSYFQCLAFSYGQAKTIRIRHVWTRIFLENGGEKISFSKISGYLWTEPASLISAKERLNIFYTAASKRFKMNFPRALVFDAKNCQQLNISRALSKMVTNHILPSKYSEIFCTVFSSCKSTLNNLLDSEY